MIKVGTVCTKTAGRENGNICIILENIDDIFVIVAGPSVRKKRCNVKHLSQLPRELIVSKGASRADASKLLADAGLVEESEEPAPKKKADAKTSAKKSVKKAEKKKDSKKAVSKKTVTAKK